MHIKTDFIISWDEKQLIQAQGRRFEQLLARSSVKQAFEQMKTRIPDILHAQAAWDIFPIKGIEHDKFVLENGIKIGGGPLTEALLGAKQLVVVLVS